METKNISSSQSLLTEPFSSLMTMMSSLSFAKPIGIENYCQGESEDKNLCLKKASQQCPTCVSLQLPSSWFCCRDCFKKTWKKHNKIHKSFTTFQSPSYNYTGPLRAYFVIPGLRTIPPEISLPDYALHPYGISSGEHDCQLSKNILKLNENQQQSLRRGGRLARHLLDSIAQLVKPGITTEVIDRYFHQLCCLYQVYPSPLNYRQFPKSLCSSVNEVVCHGIPDCRPLEEGDIVNLDITIFYEGVHIDMSETYPVGIISHEHEQLINVTSSCLEHTISELRIGMPFRIIGQIIEDYLKPYHYTVNRVYNGHGIGQHFHCQPMINHYKNKHKSGSIQPGMAFTIEPMVNLGKPDLIHWDDDWTAVTKDGKYSAQFEHTLLVNDNGIEVITMRNNSTQS